MICDTGPLVAAASRKDRDRQQCMDLIRSVPLLIVPGPVIAEAGFLIERAGGPHAEAEFLSSLTSPKYEVVAPTPKELRRAAQLVSTYADLGLGSTDAIVIAISEHRNSPEVATLDRRHFSVVKPEPFEQFLIFPETAS